MNSSVPDDKGQHYLEREFRELMQDPKTSFFLDEEILDGFWFWDLTAPEHEWMSPGFWRALGFDPAERKHLASEWQDLIFTEDGRAAQERVQQHCEDPSIPYSQLVRYHTADGGTITVRCNGTAIRENGVPTRMIGMHSIVHDSRKQELDRQLSQMVEMSGDAIVVWSLTSGIIRWNEGATQLYGHGISDAKGQDPNMLTNARYGSPWDDVERHLERGNEWSGEVHRTRADGSDCVTSSRLQRLSVTGGETLFLQIDRDVTERHSQQENQEILTHELNHRVKNLFSVIQGLVGMSARYETDVREFGDKIMARIKALAAAHLMGMDDPGETGSAGLDIRDLVKVILNPYWSIVQGSSSSGPSVHLPKRIINPLALILHELATNALKHGAWSAQAQGTISIDWRLLPPKSNAQVLELIWRETLKGTKMPDKDSRSHSAPAGFGSRLIDMSVTQLGADLVRDWSDQGLTLRLVFSIDAEAE